MIKQEMSQTVGWDRQWIIGFDSLSTGIKEWGKMCVWL